MIQKANTAGRIVVVGGINMDLFIEASRFPLPGETFEGDRFYTGGGGKGANQAIAAGRLAGPGRVSMVGRVGADGFGEELLENFERSNVDRSAVEIGIDEASGIALIFIDGDRENYVLPVYGANAQCGPRQIAAAREQLRGASVLLVQQEISLDVTITAARAARDAGVTVIVDPGPARDGGRPLHRLAHILTPNQLEAEAITGVGVTDADSAARAAEVMRKQGVPIAIVKLGEGGCFVDSDEVTGHFEAPAVIPVATVAAGDAFAGALATGLSEGLSLTESVIFANKGGAISVTRDGAQESMPWREEVDRWSGD